MATGGSPPSDYPFGPDGAYKVTSDLQIPFATGATATSDTHQLSPTPDLDPGMHSDQVVAVPSTPTATFAIPGVHGDSVPVVMLAIIAFLSVWIYVLVLAQKRGYRPRSP
jgi:hypothetical protein